MNKNEIKQFTTDSIYAFVRLFGLLWFSLLVLSLGFNVILFFVSRTQVILLGIVDTVLLFLLTFGGCFLLAKADGYKNSASFFKKELGKYAVVLVLHVLYASLFKFAIYTTGAAYDLSHIVWRLMGHNVHGIGSAPFWLYFLFLVIFDFLYLVAVILGRRCGCKKRQQDRKRLTEGNSQ